VCELSRKIIFQKSFLAAAKVPTLNSFRSLATVRMAPTMTRFYSAGPSHPTLQEIEDRVMTLLKDFDKVESDKLHLDAHFINDLSLDSLDQVEITMALEDEFSIELPDVDAEEILTPRKAVEKIFANKNAI